MEESFKTCWKDDTTEEKFEHKQRKLERGKKGWNLCNRVSNFCRVSSFGNFGRRIVTGQVTDDGTTDMEVKIRQDRPVNLGTEPPPDLE